LEPIRDLIVFDWVMALGSTQAAAEILDLPQSSVSRRYRSLASQFDIPIRRQRGSLFISGEASIYRQLQELCQRFRFEKHLYRWSWDPGLQTLRNEAYWISDGAHYIDLAGGSWPQRQDFLESRILDACFEICDDDAHARVGVIDLGLHIEIPAHHPLHTNRQAPGYEDLRRYGLHSSAFQPPAELSRQLLADGFQLSSQADDSTLALKAGRPTSGHCIALPHRLQAGWRVAPLPEQTSFSPLLLLQAIKPLEWSLERSGSLVA
jgi:DNA-binding transcriptional LysR family regulator